MLDWITVVVLILIGIALVIVEVIFIPGTTILGLIGAGLVIFGIYTAYSNFGSQMGTTVLIATLFVGGLLIFLSFKAGIWGKFALKNTNKAKFNDEYRPHLWENEEGVAVSDLRPIGKAEFGDKTFEVRTFGHMVKSGTRIKVIKVENNNIIFVEPVNK
jgi:membrane-bound ClpP family serine protease